MRRPPSWECFGRATGPLHEAIEHTPAHPEPLHILVSRRHRLADRCRVQMSDLAGATAWMPGNARDSEWAGSYGFLNAGFAVDIDTSGPTFGMEHFVERISGSSDLRSFVDEKTRIPWHSDVAQIPITEPTPVFPWSLPRRSQNGHPAPPPLITHIKSRHRPP
ncbi:hypothetical protein [Streptosporangium lutulentum]|uniref:hypothetical protein n=1 Tax=Streptosporangium lutulentum TaxID=1461250 RepID=UPI00363AD0A5